MVYEVIHGEQTHYVEGGNPYQGCLEVLRIEASKGDIPQSPFVVSHNGESEEIPMELVVGIQAVALNGEEPEGKAACCTIDKYRELWLAYMEW